jgi:hypothetical protein
VVTLRAKKCKNSSSAQRYNQISFGFHTAWVIRDRVEPAVAPAMSALAPFATENGVPKRREGPKLPAHVLQPGFETLGWAYSGGQL